MRAISVVEPSRGSCACGAVFSRRLHALALALPSARLASQARKQRRPARLHCQGRCQIVISTAVKKPRLQTSIGADTADLLLALGIRTLVDTIERPLVASCI